MKILFFENGTIWSRGLPDGLRDLGHTVRMSGPLARRRIPALLSSFRPDLIINVGWGPNHVREKQIMMRDWAKSAGIPLVYWSVEDPHFTDVFTLPLVRTMRPDFVFTTCPQTVQKFQKLGIPAAHMDFGFHPSIHRRLNPLKRYSSDIAVVANAYPHVLKKSPDHFRRKAIQILIRPLLHKGIRIDFYGRDWEKMHKILGRPIPRSWIHGYLPYKDASKVYSSAKIMLGLQNYTDMVTQRTYEIAGSSGFLFTCDTPGVRKLFKPGRDVAVSSSPEQTVRLIRRYLKEPLERERIRKRARKAIAKHSYTHRARYLLNDLRSAGLI